MGLLNSDMKKAKKLSDKNSIGTTANALPVPTAINQLAYAIGKLYTNGDGEKFPGAGISMGCINCYIGHSQSGKSTLAVQDAWAIVNALGGGDIIIANFERAPNHNKERIMQITGCTEEEYDETFVVFRQPDLSVEYIKELIFQIADKKKDMGKAALVDWFDMAGNPIKVFQPTFIIIDSVANVRSKEMLEKRDIDSNMMGAAIAKANSGFIVSVMHLLEEYNITLVGINHITTKIQINPYAPKKVTLPGLADDENIPGGNKWVFEASNILRLTAGKELKIDKDMCVEGRIVNCKIIKTRSGFNNKVIALGFHADLGFSNMITDFTFLKESKILTGGGRAGFALPNLPETSFSQKEFSEFYVADEAFRAAVDEQCGAEYYALMQRMPTTVIDAELEDFEG